MISELLGAVQAVQALGTLLDAAKGLSNYSEIVAAVSAVNSKLMEANNVALESQQKQAEQASKIIELERRLESFDRWESDFKRYRLNEIGNGVFAYTLQEDQSDGEPIHSLCINCAEQRKKSVLQLAKESAYGTEYICHGCSARFTIPNKDNPSSFITVTGASVI